MEIKHLNLQKCEVKFGAEGMLEFSGYASVFDGIDSYGDTIVKGAYTETLKDRERPVQLRWNHYGPVIGKFTEIREDDKGLFVTGELTKGHSTAEDAAALLRHGAISGLSIGYIAKEADEDGPIRKLKRIELFEISVVEEPADNSAHITGIKSAFDECKSLKDIELTIRRNCGLSQSVSTAIVSAVKNAVNQSDSERDHNALLETLNNFKL
jgi:HK97 family phage prohead protease